jgi:hypothetical protein
MRIPWADKDATGIMGVVPWFEYRHPRVFGPTRLTIGVWLLILTAILYGFGQSAWWGALLIPAASLHLCFGYRLSRLPRAARSKISPIAGN